MQIQKAVSQVLDSANIDQNGIDVLKEDLEIILNAIDLDPDRVENIISNVENVVQSAKQNLDRQ